MKLRLKNLKHFVIAINRENGRRHHVTVFKTRDGILTGDSWTEAYDSYVGEKAELESRFNARINKQPREVVASDDVVADEYDAMLESIVEPLLSVVIHEAVNATQERCLAMDRGDEVEPVQNIIEDLHNEFMIRIFNKTHLLFMKVIRDMSGRTKRRWLKLRR